MLTFIIVGQIVPVARAVTCQIQTLRLVAPDGVAIGQSVEIDTVLEITCTATNENVLARVDLSTQGSNQVLSRNSSGLGSVPVGSKTWNVTISNSAQAPSSAGTWKVTAQVWVFAGTEIVAAGNRTVDVQVLESAQITSTSSFLSSTSQSTVISVPTSPMPSVPITAALITFAVIIAGVVIMRRKRQETHQATQDGRLLGAQTKVSISTGYQQLDAALGGGLPLGYAIILVSPPFDERDMLLARMISSHISMGYSVFFLSRDMSRTRDLASKYKQGFYAFNPQADKIPGDKANIFKIQGVQNLNDVNISLNKAMESSLSKNPNRVLIIDLLSDILLEHKGLTTRKWLDDFVAKRKADNFTIFGTLNPLVVSEQERQTIMDLFDGIIEIYEKEQTGRPKRYVIVRKMYARKYKDTAIELERDSLF
jgi:KaiC/GvpD/RAD55 family RecA-like ATPase